MLKAATAAVASSAKKPVARGTPRAPAKTPSARKRHPTAPKTAPTTSAGNPRTPAPPANAVRAPLAPRTNHHPPSLGRLGRFTGGAPDAPETTRTPARAPAACVSVDSTGERENARTPPAAPASAAPPASRDGSSPVARRMFFSPSGGGGEEGGEEGGEGGGEGESGAEPSKRLRVAVAREGAGADDASAPPSTRRSAVEGAPKVDIDPSGSADPPPRGYPHPEKDPPSKKPPLEKPPARLPDPESPPLDPASPPEARPDFGPPRTSNPFAAAAAAAKARREASAAQRAAADARRSARPPPRSAGFANLGNTCYLNAVLQALCGLERFADDAAALGDAAVSFSAAKTRGPAAPSAAPSVAEPLRVAVATRNLVRDVRASRAAFEKGGGSAARAAAVSPAEVKRAVQRRHPRYAGAAQHDAHEFLCEYLDALEEEAEALNTEAPSAPHATRVSVVCPTRRHFQGALETTLTCVACGAKSAASRETFRHVSLDLPAEEASGANGKNGAGPADLRALLAAYFADERVERRCDAPGCDGTAATLARRVAEAPEVLVAHLKRFRCETRTRGGGFVGGGVQSGGAGSRDDERVSQMTPRLVAHKAVGRVAVPEEASLPASGASPGARYALRAVVSHVGPSLESGHYVARVKVRGVSAAGEGEAGGGGAWATFDDEEVEDARGGFEEVARGEKNERECYVAVFERVRE
jgi:ubiquitin C-terminal hydrolase